MTPDFKILAAVQFNKREAYVLNRNPQFKYVREGDNLVARDGPFLNLYYYEKPSKAFKAFAGREFDIPMLDGTKVKASGQWWSGQARNLQKITYNTKSELLKCYVFYGAQADAEALAALRAKYDGCVYPYREYETILNKKQQQDAIRKRDKIIRVLKKQLGKNHKVSVDLMEQLARDEKFPEWRLKRFVRAQS